MPRPIAIAAQTAEIDLLILVVGEVGRWQRQGLPLPRMTGFSFAGYDDLARALGRPEVPDVIMGPLVSHSFDALDLARRLVELQYRGRFRVVSGPVPRPQSILAELRAAAPGLDIELFLLPAS